VDDLTKLIDILKKRTVKTSETPIFKLASGKMSDFYANCKPTTMCSDGMILVGRIIWSRIKDLDVVGIGGLTFGADPIANAVCMTAGMAGKSFYAFSVRKELKDHGIIKWVEGPIEKGDNVVIVEDVTTTGGSAARSIERARLMDLNVVKVIVLIDRQEGGLDIIRGMVPDTEAILTREMLFN
jgi:orotate phosphoribosyltransferase